MIKHEIFYFGLSRAELQTLRCRFSFAFQFLEIRPEDFEDLEKINFIVSKSWCAFINPKKITYIQLESILYEHEYAKRNCHATMLVFTQPFTREQNRIIDTKDLLVIDLLTRFDRPIRDVADVVRKAVMPCWNGLKKMQGNMFNDGWYLLDIETTGIDPTTDEVISISIAYMAAYELKYHKTIYIKQKEQVSDDVVELTGITNEMLEQGLTRQEAVDFLNNLRYKAPIIVKSYDHYIPFLQELYHLCGDKFELPYVEIDGLASIVFSYMCERNPINIINRITDRKYPRNSIDHSFLMKLYDLTLSVFENLQERYGVRAPGHFHSLYDADIQCGD